MQEVVGSIPSGSTTSAHFPHIVLYLALMDQCVSLSWSSYIGWHGGLAFAADFGGAETNQQTYHNPLWYDHER